MKTQSSDSIVSKKIICVALVTALLLFVPLLAMQLTDEVNWTSADFAVAGALLFGAGLMYVLATLRVRSVKRRAIIGAALAVVLALTWAELAVGIFG